MNALAPAAGEATFGELLAPTGLPALLDTTPGQLLADLGGRVPDLLPDLGAVTPEVDLSGLAAALDPTGLLAPLTGLLRVFGTGTAGGTGIPGDAGAGQDPVAALTGLAQTLQTGMGVASSALRAVDGLWTGDAAGAAATRSAATAADTAAVAAQGTALSAGLQGALGIVATGLAQVQGIVVATAGKLAATLPVIGTPPGQLAALGIAAEGLAEGIAAVSATHAQLAAPTAEVAAQGSPVPVAAAPNTGSPLALTADLLDGAAPLVGTAAQLAGALLGGAGGAAGASTTPGGPSDPVPGSTLPGSTVTGNAVPVSTVADRAVPGAVPAGSAPSDTATGDRPVTVRPAALSPAGLTPATAQPAAPGPEPVVTLGDRPASTEPLLAARGEDAPGWTESSGLAETAGPAATQPWERQV
ncbi:hypothetical protein [Gordonia sp. VNK21]|uniref:hypothetical protein n=1 Tax=Gordonia sp. VNK21 TaxID=3382483 RepID=UPI0038D4731A